MKKDNFKKGRAGEKIARDYLTKIGYEHLESNHRNDKGEIDLIMKDKDWLVFVEVKYKKDEILGKPEDMLDKHKLGRVYQAALMYLTLNSRHRQDFDRFRIDAVCILGDKINLYRNVYE